MIGLCIRGENVHVHVDIPLDTSVAQIREIIQDLANEFGVSAKALTWEIDPNDLRSWQRKNAQRRNPDPTLN